MTIFAIAPVAVLFSGTRVVGFHVLAQMVRAHEALVANGTRKALFARVRSQMPLQLVGARKPLTTEQPVTNKRSLTSMPAEVGLEVGRLAVHLSAAGYVTRMDVSFPKVGPGGTKSVSFLTVRTITRRSASVPSLGPRGWDLGQRGLRQTERGAHARGHTLPRKHGLIRVL